MMKFKPLALTITLGVFLRMAFLFHHDIWFDESISILISRFPIKELLAAASLDNNPPIYYLLLHFWMSVSSEAAWLRLPSLLFSAATIPTVFFLAKSLANEKVAHLASLITAIMPVQLYYSGETRPYAPYIFLSIFLFYLATRSGQNLRKRHQFFITALLTDSLLLIHYSGILVVLLAGIFRAKSTHTRVKSWMISTLIGILLAFPWYWNALAQPHPSPWNPKPLLSIAYSPIAATAGFTGIASPTALLELPPITQIVVALLAIITVMLLATSLVNWLRKRKWGYNRILVLATVIAIVSVTIQQFNNLTFFITPRLVLPFTPLIYILLAKQLEPRPRLKKIFLVLTVLAVVLNFLPPARGPMLSKAISKVAESYLAPVLHTSPSTYFPSQTYSSKSEHLYIGPHIFPYQLARTIGGIPIPKGEAFDRQALTLVIDTKNTLPQVREATERLLNQSHQLTSSQTVDSIMVQHYTRLDKLFATNE